MMKGLPGSGFAAVLATLEQERAAVAGRLAAIDAALAALRKGWAAPRPRGGGTVTHRPTPGGRGRGFRLSPPLLAQAKALAARAGLRVAAEATGISYTSLWARAKKEGWQVQMTRKGPRAGQERVPAPSVRSVGTACPKCHIISPTNPCDLCGTRKAAA